MRVLVLGVSVVVRSSQDVYAPFGGFRAGQAVSAVPLDESARLRAGAP
ncbi:hypothetical protein ACT4S2_07840 [Kocuria turfanensis]